MWRLCLVLFVIALIDALLLLRAARSDVPDWAKCGVVPDAGYNGLQGPYYVSAQYPPCVNAKISLGTWFLRGQSGCFYQVERSCDGTHYQIVSPVLLVTNAAMITAAESLIGLAISNIQWHCTGCASGSTGPVELHTIYIAPTNAPGRQRAYRLHVWGGN